MGAIVGTKAHSFPSDRTLDAGSIEAWVTELMSASVVSANARSLPHEESGWSHVNLRFVRVEVQRSGCFMASVAAVAVLVVFAFVAIALRRRTRVVAVPAVKKPLL